MKKIYRLQNLDCAACAAKMERAIAKIDGVSEVSINFITQKLIINAADTSFDKIMDEVKKVCKKVEPDCKIEG